VTVRDGPQTVRHEANQISTVVEPADFAVKSYYIYRMVYFNLREDIPEFIACIAYFQNILGANGVNLPWIAADWGVDEAEEGLSDYRHRADLLAEREGRDAVTGEPVSLYYGLSLI
jgi:hypothetical protein